MFGVTYPEEAPKVSTSLHGPKSAVTHFVCLGVCLCGVDTGRLGKHLDSCDAQKSRTTDGTQETEPLF